MEQLTLMFLMGLVLGSLIGAFVVCSFVVNKENDQSDVINRAIEELEIWQPKEKILQEEKEYLLDILKGVDKE